MFLQKHTSSLINLMQGLFKQTEAAAGLETVNGGSSNQCLVDFVCQIHVYDEHTLYIFANT